MTATRLGFGCAGLMRVPSARRRQALLERAYEEGVRHFDVARMYGLGQAEGELGRFVRGRREGLTIATKFGIDPSGRASALAPLQAPARAALARFPALGRVVRRREHALHGVGDYSPAKARVSLETSLRRLGVDHVDLFLVHDPGESAQVEMAALGPELEAIRERGLIGAWGLAGEAGPCRRLAAASGLDPVLQMRDSMIDPLTGAPPAEIVYGVLSGALDRLHAHLAAPGRAAAWSAALGVDCGDRTRLGQLLLAESLDRNPGAIVLFSTTRPERLAPTLAAAQVEVDLAAFRSLVAAELGGPVGVA